MLDMLIRNGQVVTPEGVGRWDVAVQGEKIVAVAAPGTLAGEAGRVIDATGKLVIPGGIDPHVHLNAYVPRLDGTRDMSAQPSQVGRASLFGGTTTMVDFVEVPSGNASIAEAVEEHEQCCRDGYCDYGLHIHLFGEVPPEVIQQIPETISAGFASFKVFTTDVKPSRHGRMVPTGYIWGILEQTARHGAVLLIHAEDDEIIRYMSAKLEREGRTGYENMPLVHNIMSEDLAFRRVIRLARYVEGGAIYLVHISAGAGVDAVAEARAAGYPVYGETLHNYMCLTADCYLRPDGMIYQTYPSLKYEADCRRLWSGARDGAVSTVATDEVNTKRAVKTELKYVYNVTGGHVGTETRVPIIYSEGVAKGRLSLERFVALTSTNAAKILGMYPQKGAIAVGSDADLVVYDPDVRRTLQAEELHGSDYSVWEGWEVQGWPAATILRGKIAVENGEFKLQPGQARRPFCKLSPAIQAGPAA